MTSPVPSTVRRTRFEPDDVRLLQRQFGGVLDRDDALVVGDERRQRVEQRRLARARSAGDEHVEARPHTRREHESSMLLVNAPKPTSCSAVIDAPKRRIDSTGPSIASGGMIALTREPSGRRASTIGLDSSTRRPTRLTMRSITAMRCASSRKRVATLLSLPPFSTQMSFAPLMRMSLTFGSRKSGSIGPRPNTSWTTCSTIDSRSAVESGVLSARRKSATPRRT